MGAGEGSLFAHLIRKKLASRAAVEGFWSNVHTAFPAELSKISVDEKPRADGDAIAISFEILDKIERAETGSSTTRLAAQRRHGAMELRIMATTQ